ncbi:MAG: ABC transporter ATP-binding protein [Candidatus Thermoplasmatota archaeon]|nr:ABC transporter ATP-binding protein [Candidatus Thermoplasmatota archaeon]
MEKNAPVPSELTRQMAELTTKKETLEKKDPIPTELTRQMEGPGIKIRDLELKLSALTYSHDLLRISMRKDGSLDDYNEKIRAIRWTEISMIFQGAMNAFNPVFRIGDLIVEAIQLHEDVDDETAKKRAMDLFEFVGISPDRISNYPHEFSGGMKQRAMIALALALKPSFIIADEPTTALDVITQDRVLMEIKKLQEKLNMAMMIITHDVSVVAEVSDKIGVMYAGMLMEIGETSQVFKNTAHPYTAGLLNSFPSIKGERKRLETIPGFPPDLVNPPSGCPFHPRCQYAQTRCSEKRPKGMEIEPGHTAYCHFAGELWDRLRRG